MLFGLTLTVLLSAFLQELPTCDWKTQPTFDELLDHIQTKKIKTIEGVLACLPKDFREYNVMVYDSKGTGHSSYEFPRVIFYGDNGKFVVAVYTDPKEDGFFEMETISFSENESASTLRDLIFDPEAQELPKASGRNPEECLVCHKTDPRPNWNDYAFWPGAFGSVDDNPSKETSGMEVRWLNQHRLSRSGRMSFIENFDALFDREEGETDRFHSGRVKSLPNARFAHKLMELNAKRIARKIMNHPKYNELRYLFLGISMACPDIVDKPAVKWNKKVASDWAKFYEVSKKEHSQSYIKNPEGTVFTDNSVIVPLRFLFAQENLDTSDWSLGFKDEWKFSNPAAGFYEGITRELMKKDSALSSMSSVIKFVQEEYPHLGSLWYPDFTDVKKDKICKTLEDKISGSPKVSKRMK
jgi:hypothetical protein